MWTEKTRKLGETEVNPASNSSFLEKRTGSIITVSATSKPSSSTNIRWTNPKNHSKIEPFVTILAAAAEIGW